MAVTGPLTVLYRGPLASCNYACSYCPFAKRVDSPADVERDTHALARFVGWARARTEETRVLFTPWGEALVRRAYREALVELSHLPAVRRVAIQTNLHAPLEALGRAKRDVLALWCTFHPTETSREAFVARCAELDAMGVRYSVGVVGMREHLAEIDALRASLRPDVYVWVNAYKRVPGYYAPDEVARILETDPLFALNATRHPSRGAACRAGSTVISVDGEGNARRCHFVDAPLGNLYDGSLRLSPEPSPCPNETCGCHIGYSHLVPVRLDRVFGDGVLERIPEPRALGRESA